MSLCSQSPKVGIFVINLDESTERLEQVCRELGREKLSFERISAVDGRKLKDGELSRHYSEALNRQQYHKILNRSEIGCYLSHRKAWQSLLDDQLDYALILEDDFEIQGCIDDILSDARQVSFDWDYIKLAEHPVKRGAVYRCPIGEQFELIMYNKVPSRTCAQLVSRAGAQKLLEHSERFGRPVDVDLQYWWEMDLNIFGLRPYLIKPALGVDSIIDKQESRHQQPTAHVTKLSNQIRYLWRQRLENRRRLSQLRREQS